MKRSQQSWVKTFMQDVMDENGQVLFDHLTWFAKKLCLVMTIASACEHMWSIEGWIRINTTDTQKSLRSPPNHFFLTQTVFYYLLAPRSDIVAGGRYTWHPLHKSYVRLTPTHCFTVLLLRITPALLLSWLSGCPMLANALSWSRCHPVPSAHGNVTRKNAIFQ